MYCIQVQVQGVQKTTACTNSKNTTLSLRVYTQTWFDAAHVRFFFLICSSGFEILLKIKSMFDIFCSNFALLQDLDSQKVRATHVTWLWMESPALSWEHYRSKSLIPIFASTDSVSVELKDDSQEAHTTRHLYVVTTIKTTQFHKLGKKNLAWKTCFWGRGGLGAAGSEWRSSEKQAARLRKPTMSEQVTGSMWLGKCRAQRTGNVQRRGKRGTQSVSHLDRSFFGWWIVL